MSPEPAAPAPGSRSQLDLMTAQLAAIDAWNRAHRASEVAAESAAMTREMRLDLNRRMQARRREQQALLARANQQLRTSGGVLHGSVAPRALRTATAGCRDTVARRLEQRGVMVVGLFDDGAEAAGTVVVEQPDIVLVEDRLPTLSGVDLVRRVREFAPQAIVGAQVLDSDGIQTLVEAGAQAVFTRRIPPADIADQLVECLQGSGRPVALR